jgi:glycosyltransferase involved in cell wall biosynthesis
MLSDDRFRYLFHSNRKQALSKNAGLLAATGLYITFLDSDDEYDTEHLELRSYILNQNPNIDLLHGGVKILGNEFVPDMHNTENRIHLSECIIGGTFFIRNSLSTKLDGFEPVEYGDDTIFFNKAVKSGLTIAKTDLSTYLYHRHSEDSICNTIHNSE